MAPTSTPPKASAPTAGQPFKIFCDTHKPPCSGPSAFNADFYDFNNENTPSAATSKPVSKPTANLGPAPSASRVPLTDVTQEELQDALEAPRTRNREMKGKIVAYQDALNQAYTDGYL
ncbi:hypothetical protein E8E12_006241 [Didymella heteroderae]|uniref:Uncharacterized protein n=1 Tax=Didymella heteroderae TaxID=1769908 RepID=A0A9P4WME4_9PLEO|nr:hypothetical protein E8E12_006241 [Didymella heteroderae]